jgi:hypothetical protein
MPTYSAPSSNDIHNVPAPGKPYDMAKLNSAAQTQAALTNQNAGAPGVPLQGQSQQAGNNVAMMLAQSKENSSLDKVGGKRRSRKSRKSRKNRKRSKKHRKKIRR